MFVKKRKSNNITEIHSTDTALTSPRQAVSEGLTTSHQLANIEWKNKPVIQEKSSKQSNLSNFVLDQVSPGVLNKQELSSHHHLQEQISMVGEAIRQTNSATTNNKIPTDNSSAAIMSHHRLQDEMSMAAGENHKTKSPTTDNRIPTDNSSAVIMSHHHLQDEMSMAAGENHTTKSPTTDNRIPTDNSSAMIKNTMKLRNHSTVASSVVENDSIKNNSSAVDSQNKWFTNTSLAMGNSSISTLHNNHSTVKPYTAADYLQTLYPQLSVFKAPFEIDEKNPSSAKDSMKTSPAPLHSLPLYRNNRSLSKNSSSPLIKLILNNERTNKLSPEMQRKVQKALLMSLLRSPSNLGQRSVVKQGLSTPRYISSASNLLLTRSKKPGKQAPGYRYLTEAGAKLLPAHIFSPLGSVFKDHLGPSPVPLKTTSSTPVPTTAGIQHKTKTDPSIEPTQIGLIQPQTKSKSVKEPSSPPVIVPTQSGMIPVAPTTANPFVSTLSGFIASPSDPVEAIVPTRKPFVPTESGFIPPSTNKYGHNMWRQGHETQHKPKPAFVEKGLPPHETQLTFDFPQELGTTNVHAKVEQGNKNHARKSHDVNSHIGDSQPAYSRKRRQMFVPLPLMQASDNSQQLAQSFIPLAGQLPDQPLLSNLQQFQQPVQQLLPTQPLQSLLSQFVPPPQTLDPLQLFGQPGKMVLQSLFNSYKIEVG